jgi:lipopolysaccharide biosynthesis glycosyltransferase
MALNGVIYYITGDQYLTRLAVSLHSLRKVYSGHITIMLWRCKKQTIDFCNVIGSAFKASIKNIDPPLAVCKQDYFLVKSKLPLFSDYENTIYLDADTLVRKNIDELFDLANKNDFVVSNIEEWTKTKRTLERLMLWKCLYPKHVKSIQLNYIGINCGVFAFNRRSTLIKNWYNFAVKGKDLFVPDEDACALMLCDNKHILVSEKYNCMWKYRKPKSYEDFSIIHYHGNRHTRSHYWKDEYSQTLSKIKYLVNYSI